MGTSRWAFKQDLAAELQIARFHSNLLERLRTGYLPYGDLEDWLRLIYLNARELEEKEKVIIGGEPSCNSIALHLAEMPLENMPQRSNRK
jgi:hypothetical protein